MRPFTPMEHDSIFRVHPCLRNLLAFLSVVALLSGSQVSAQEDDPDGLLVPPGLKIIADSPPTDDNESDPASPRTKVGDDVKTEIVGKVVTIDDRVITILDGDDQTRKFRVGPDARIELDDETARLRDLRPGDTVRLKSGGSPDFALGVRAVSPPPSSAREPDGQLR